MSQTETIQTPQDYVNYTFNIEARGVAEVSSELMGLSNTVGTILGQLAFKTSEFLSHTDTLAIGTGVAIGAMFASATKDAIHFQQQIANVQAIGGEAINSQSIGDAAMEYSNKFGMATASMTEGLEALARAGITSTNVMKEVLAEGVKLSKLEGLDLEDSINDLISTTNLLSEAGVDMNDANYGKLVQDMNQHIVSTSESAPINAQNIIQTLQHVGGYASASGMDQEDLFAVIAQLGSRGTKGEMAGTALRAFIAAGQKDTAQRALARIGLNVSDLWSDSGETMLPISEMKQVLDDALEARGYSKQEKLEFYSDFAGYKQANQIMKIDTSEVQKYKEDIANAWDLGKKLDVILGTVRGNLDRIWQITQNFMTKVGSQLLTVMNAILTPVRILLDIFTKIPFADTAVAAGMIFVGFRTGLMIFNKIVPVLTGFVTGISNAKSETRGFRGEWEKTRDAIKEAKDTLHLIKVGDKESLVNKAVDEHQLIGRNREEVIDMLAGQYYMKSSLYDKYHKQPWQELPSAQKFLIKLQLQGKEDFKQNYDETLQRMKDDAQKVADVKLDLTKKEDIDQLEAVNVWLKNIYDLLKGERTVGTDDTPVSNRESNRQANYISKIMSQYGITSSKYGDYTFKYDNEEDISKLKENTNATIKRIEKQVKDFDNTDFSKIGAAQRELYRKQLFKSDAENQARKDYSLDSHESEVRFALEHGRVTDASKWYSDTYRTQLAQMGDALGMVTTGIDRATSEELDRFVADMSVAIQALGNSKEKIDEIASITRESWDTHLDTTNFSFLKRNQGMAQDIANALSIDTNQHDTVADAVISFFGQDNNQTNANINKAIEIMFGYSNSEQGKMGSLEQESLRFTLDKLQRERNTFQSFINQDMYNESREEMSRIIEQLDANNTLFREGGTKLGAALTKGFIEDGMGIHSPGYIYKALYAELDAVKFLLSEFDVSDYANDILSGFNPKQFAIDNTKYSLKPGELQKADLNNQNAVKWSVANTVRPVTDYVNPYAEALNKRARRSGFTIPNSYIDKALARPSSDKYKGSRPKRFLQFLDETNSKLNDSIWNKSLDLNKNTVFYRGGYLPKFNDNGIGFFDSVTSTTYNKGIGDSYADEHGGLLSIYAPHNVRSLLAGGNITRYKEYYPYEQERMFGYGQPIMQVGDTYDYKTSTGEVVDAADMIALSPQNVLGMKIAIENEITDINDLLKSKFPELKESSYLLAHNMTDSFIHDGLGRHSPGDWYKAVDEETLDVMDLIDNRSDKIGDMIRSFLGDNRESLINELQTMDGLVTGLGEKKVRIQGEDGKNRFQSYDAVIDDLMTQALFNLEDKWKGDRFTAGDILMGNAPEGADLKDALDDKDILEFYQSLSSDDILNEIQQMTIGNISNRTQAIEIVKRIKEQILENFIQNQDNFIQLDENSLGAVYEDWMEGPSFPMFNLNADRDALDLYNSTWGRILFNYEGNKVLRSDFTEAHPDDLLEDSVYGDIPDALKGKTIAEATTILNDAMRFGSAGILLDMIAKRAGHLNTDEETGIGVLAGTTSVAYTDDMAERYDGHSITGRKHMIEIYAPMGTKGFNFDDRPEYTLPANTAYIELSRGIDEWGNKVAKILLLTEEQMAAIGFNRKNAEGNYIVDVEKSIFQQLFNPQNVDSDYSVNQQQADWLKYIDELTMTITDAGRADMKFMEFLNSTLPTLIESSLHQGFVESRDVFNIIREVIPDVQSYEQMMTLLGYGTQNLHDDGGRFYEEDAWQNIMGSALNEIYNSHYARKEAKRQQKEQEELINARTQADIENSTQYTEDIDAQNPMFTSMSDYYNYISNNKYGRARSRVQSQTGLLGRDIFLKGIDIAEQADYKIRKHTGAWYEQSQQYAQEHGSNNLEWASEQMKDVMSTTKQFSNALSSLSDIFPILTPAVMALDTALQIQEAVSWGLKAATDVLTFAKTGETQSTFLQTMANWANSESALQAAAGQMVLTGVTWLASAAEAVLAFIRSLSRGTLLVLAAAILVVIAAIEAVKFWENKHAEALKESQKALEEATAKNNVALSQYKDLKKARENETDAIKKQQAARKEAIALYELEASRIKKRKAVQDEAKLRNDAVWGEYGLRASLQKMGLGFIAGGDFQSQYENYDGTTANIRQIKESTLGNLFASSEQRYVASVYDKNSAFFAEVEAYKEPLQELYDKESQLIEQYGSIDLARGTKEFEDAVQEFADATGINGETAVKMLEWLETENKVNQATKVGQAQIGVIRARADAKVAGLEYGEGGDLNDMDNLGNAMVMAQFQEMMNTAKTEVWWELLYAYLDTFISILLPWKWGEVGKNLATVGIRQEELAELDAEGNNILSSMYDAYENADRRDYGAGVSYYADTPFGGALDSAAVMYADDAQQQYFAQTGSAMTEDDYQAVKSQYQEDTFGVTNEGLKQQKAKEDIEAYEKAKEEKENNKATDTLGQLQNNGEQAHQDALDIIDAIKNPGVVSGIGAGISKLLGDSLFDSLTEFSLDDVFSFMRGEDGTITSKLISKVKGPLEGVKTAYGENGIRGVYDYGKTGIKNLSSRFSAEVAGARDINGWVKSGGVDMERTLFQKGVGLYDGAKAAYADDGLKGLASFGKEAGKDGIKGLSQVGKAASGELNGARGLVSSVSSEVGGVKGLASSTASGMKDLMNPKALAGGIDDIAKGAKGGGSLMKGIGKVGGRALAFLGPALAFADKASELNPMETHYNEDGTEKKALQATGEVVGTTAGALGGVAGGIAGAEAGGALGAAVGTLLLPGIGTAIGGAIGTIGGGIIGGWLGDTIFQPIGDAIGGTIGWLGDNLLGGIQSAAGTIWDGLTGAAGGVWDFVTNGGVLGMGINAASGIFDWLTGGNNDPYKNIEKATGQKMPPTNKSENTVIIKNININTEDDPEKIKSALMNLIIEMQEQISPRQVSRTVGEPPAQSTSTTQDENNTPEAEGTDPQSGAQNGDQNNNPTT